MNEKKVIIGVCLGEACGIGPEIMVKALSDETLRNEATWVIVDSLKVLQQGESAAGSSLTVEKITDPSEIQKENGKIYFINLGDEGLFSYEMGTINAESGKATANKLRKIVDLAKRNVVDGVVYAPLNKESLQRGGLHFSDEMHFFANLFGIENEDSFGEINVMGKLWVARVTSHIPMKEVSSQITKNRVLSKIQFANKYLKAAGIPHPVIYVAAYNAHCGEGGLVGREEIDSIIPAITQAKMEGINVNGPYAADTVFLHRDNFDCILSMYHDQAQIGMKLLGFSKGITIDAGLPVVLGTPAHGTAFDIAGKGSADPNATKACAELIIRMSMKNR